MAVNKNFVVKNGIEVSNNLIYGDSTLQKVGIGKTNPSYRLDVDGGVGMTSAVISNGLSLTGQLALNGVPGQSGQFPVSTGTGVTWQNVPGLRNLETIVATENQDTFNVTYTVSNGIDVFINGTRLSPSDYTASNGSTVVLNVPCFGGELVDFVSYSVFGVSAPGLTIKNNSVGVGSTLAITQIDFNGFKDVTLSPNGVGVTVYSGLNDNIVFSGITTFKLASVTSPTQNSQLSFELTNNTTLTVRVKGNDGTVRTATIALS